MNQKAISIGIESYKEIVDRPYYYVDKTLLIKDLLDNGTLVSCFTRPRRFGKTLALSMLKTFFELEMDSKGNVIDNSHYFEGMKIAEAGECYMNQQGKYPVISLSLKSAKQPDFDMAYQCMIQDIAYEYDRHRYVLLGEALSDADKAIYTSIMERKGEKAQYATSLKFLAECLKKYHGRNVVILIDEYDVPLENAYFRGFYNQMIDFVRSLFESALKTNDSLEFAVITGCLRISRESIFTGLNNLEVISVLNENYSEYYGFTESEVKEMLRTYGLEEKLQEVKQWYDGYLFGNTEVYNPWSVINYVKNGISGSRSFPQPYWSNTSSNSIVRELIDHADLHVKKEIEELIAGGTIEKPVHEDITYEDIHKTQDNLWNFLFFTGYLKKTDERFEVDTSYLTMTIPNEEVRFIYRNNIKEWFDNKLKNTDLNVLYNAVLDGNCTVFEEQVNNQLAETISYYDYAESYYHGFLCGLLKGCNRYATISNRESGNGRPDIVLAYPSARGPVIILELKVAKRFQELEAGCDAALEQIEQQNYAAYWENEGYTSITKYGICFYKKECMVKKFSR